MSGAIRTSWQLWRAPRARTVADRAYLGYMGILLALVTIAPLARGMWMLVTDPVVTAWLLPEVASAEAALIIAAVWVAALVTGRFRGPVVFAPFLAFAFSASPIPRRHAHARPFWRAAITMTLIGTLVAALVSAAWAAQGAATLMGLAGLIVAGAACGMIAAVLWLFGQCASVRATGIVVVLLATVGAAVAAARMALLVPVGATLLAACAVVAAALVPWMLDRLHAEMALAQSVRWEAAQLHAGVLDLSASAATYQALPRGRHRFFAIRRAGRLATRILIRDGIAATRTPARLVAGAAGLLVAGGLMMLALASPSILVAAIAGLVTYVAVGPLTDGLRHAADASAALPLYGVSDLALVASHVVFPLLAAMVLLVLGGAAVLLWLPAALPLAASWAASIVLALTSVGGRLMGALKPPMPVALLVPMPTPMGDMAALARMVWAIDGVVVAVFAGVAASMILSAPWMPVVMLAGGLAVIAHRWNRR